MPGVVRHGYNMALPLLRGAHAARIYSRRLQWLTTPKLFWSLYYNQVTYAMIKSPILWTTYLYYNQVTHTIVKLLTTSREVNEARWPHTCRPCAFEKKKPENSAPPKTHNEIHSSPTTACNSRRHAMKYVPCVGPYSPDSIDSGFLEIGLVQLSQSVKTTNVTHTHTHTDRQINNGTLYAPQYEEFFLP